MKLYFKSILYSFKIIYKSSGLLIIVYLFFNLLYSILPLVSTFILKNLIDSLLDEFKNYNHIMIYIFLYMATFVFISIIESLKRICYDFIFEKARHKYDCDLLRKLDKLPLSIIDSSDGKNMITDVRYTKVSAVHIADNIIRIVSCAYSFVVASVALFLFDFYIALFCLLLTVPGIIMDVVFDHKAERLRMKTAPDVRKFSYYRWMLTDICTAKDVRMYNLTEPIKERYNEEKKCYLNENKKLDKKKVLAAITAEVIMRAGELMFITFIILKAIRGEITLGNVTFYIGLLLSTTTSFKTMSEIFVFGYYRTKKMMGRFFDFNEITYDENEPKRKIEEFKSLQFDEVYFKYPYTDKYILCGVSFTIKKGDKISLIGINGSGKTTIIKLILGFYEIESGQIYINGYPISDYEINDIRKMFSVLFQNFIQYPLSLRSNVSISDVDRQEKDKEIYEAMKESGIYDDVIRKLYNGLDSYMTRYFDNYGIELSKGQWQKIALARTYFKKAQVVVLDEPSSALDAEAEDMIFNNFKKLSDEKTSIMISHRISVAQITNKIIVLDEGKIVETGNHNELIKHGGVYAKLYNLQKEKYTIMEEI